MINKNHNILSAIILICGMATFHSHLSAQLATYSGCRIEGRIFDRNSGEPLQWANVIVENSHMGATTDDSGHYCISKLLPGTYTLRATLLGYASIVRDGVRVADSTTSHVDFPLPSWCYTWSDSAEADIRRGVVQILLSGLVVGHYESPEGKKLTHRYGFEYLSSCTLNPDCAEFYNQVVEKFLEKRNGNGWYDRFLVEFKGLDSLEH